MLHRTWSSIALLFAVGCQSAPADLEPVMAWQGYAGNPQDDVEGELAELRSLLVELAMGEVGDRTLPVSAPIEAVAGAGLTSEVAALRGRVDQLGVMLSANGAVQPIHASLRAAGPSTNQETAAIESLQAALIVLEAERAIHSENIANSGVPGHKSRSLRTGAMLDDVSGVSIPIVTGSSRNMGQGSLKLTGNQLDLAVMGEGFFEIQLPNGDPIYTRRGAFREDFNGVLVTSAGFLLTDQVDVSQDGCVEGVSISPDGQVFAQQGDNTQTQIGTIRLHTFANPAGLKAIEDSFFVPTVSSGEARGRQPGVQGTGTIKQGYLERSNVRLMDEVASLRQMQRKAASIKLALASFGIYSL